MKPLILWDIDGTLLSTGGAGRGALDAAFEDLHGVPRAFKGVNFGGRTDIGIATQAFTLAGLPYDDAAIQKLLETYLPMLQARLVERRGDIVLHPAVPSIVDECAPLATNALLTGNWREGARHKLQAVGLWDRFAFGAFGDDSANRNDLVPVARGRCPYTPPAVVVIGDTLADIACARAGGAIAVAVCTGWADGETLVGGEPDLLLEDLDSGREALLELLSGLG